MDSYLLADLRICGLRVIQPSQAALNIISLANFLPVMEGKPEWLPKLLSIGCDDSDVQKVTVGVDNNIGSNDNFVF